MKRRDPGSGGVAIFVRKDLGPAKVAKVGTCEDLLWVEVQGMNQVMFVAVAYMVPASSNWHENNPVLRRELQEDMLLYRRHGVVVVMGDFNSRIGESIPISSAQNCLTRQNSDKESNANGRELLNLMKICEVTITTGLYGLAGFTCWRDRGNSVVDHICIDARHAAMILRVDTQDDIMNRITTDHSLVTAELTWERMVDVATDSPEPKKRIQKPRVIALNRVTNKVVWKEFLHKCNGSDELARVLQDALACNAIDPSGRQLAVESKWSIVKGVIRTLEGWARKIVEEKGILQFKFIGKRIKSDRKIADLLVQKRLAWNRFKECTDVEDKKLLGCVFRNCRNRLKKARKALKLQHKKQVIQEIEGLQNMFPGVFWRKLKELSGSRKKKKSMANVAIDEHGTEFSGEAAIMVWKNAFEKLGKQEEIKESFDESHFEKIECEVKDIEHKNIGRGEGGLNAEIQLEEVKQAINKLKNGKASGDDDIVNEVIKYGGEQVSRFIWLLCRECFELEHIPQDWMKGVIFPLYKEGDYGKVFLP